VELATILLMLLELNLKNKDTERLESIRAAHETARSESSSRMEDYLEVILELVELKDKERIWRMGKFLRN